VVLATSGCGSEFGRFRRRECQLCRQRLAVDEVADDSTVTTIPVEVGAHIDLMPDGRFLINDGVNAISGRFTTSGTQVTVGSVGSTYAMYGGNDPVRLAVIAAFNDFTAGTLDGSSADGPVQDTIVRVSGTALVVQAHAPADVRPYRPGRLRADRRSDGNHDAELNHKYRRNRSGRGSSGIGTTVQSMTATDDPARRAQFGPHRFYAGEGGGSEQFRGARFDVADMRGARFTDCDLTGVTISDGWAGEREHLGIPQQCHNQRRRRQRIRQRRAGPSTPERVQLRNVGTGR